MQELTQGISMVGAIPVKTSVIFANHKGVYKKGIEKGQRKMLAKVRFIEPFLELNEHVLLVTRACSPASMMEQFFNGAMIVGLKASYLVFTNLRIIHIPVTMWRGKYRDCIAQIRYGDIVNVKSRWSGLKFTYFSGKKEKFFNTSGKWRNKMRVILAGIEPKDSKSETGERTHLCPRCKAELTEDVFQCEACGLEFKNKKKAMKMTALVPGGGFFYTRHWLMGIGDVLVELWLWLAMIGTFLGIAEGDPEASSGGIIFIAIIIAMERFHCVYDTDKFVEEFIPTETKIQVRKDIGGMTSGAAMSVDEITRDIEGILKS